MLTVLITGCTISNNSSYGLYLRDSSPAVSDSTISGNGDYAVFYNIGSLIPDIYNNTFSGNANPGILVSGGNIPDNHTLYAQTGGLYNPDGKGCQVIDFVDYIPWTNSVTDSDKDGLSNFVEALAGTDPNDVDTDNDGVPDVEEIQNGIFQLGPYEDDSDDQVTSGSGIGSGGGGGGGCFIGGSYIF